MASTSGQQSTIFWDGTKWHRIGQGQPAETARETLPPATNVHQITLVPPPTERVVERIIYVYPPAPVCHCQPRCGLACRAIRWMDRAVSSCIAPRHPDYGRQQAGFAGDLRPVPDFLPDHHVSQDRPPYLAQSRSFPSPEPFEQSHDMAASYPGSVSPGPYASSAQPQDNFLFPPSSSRTRRHSTSEVQPFSSSVPPLQRSASAERTSTSSVDLRSFPDPLVFDYLQNPNSQWSPNGQEIQLSPPPTYVESQYYQNRVRRRHSNWETSHH